MSEGEIWFSSRKVLTQPPLWRLTLQQIIKRARNIQHTQDIYFWWKLQESRKRIRFYSRSVINFSWNTNKSLATSNMSAIWLFIFYFTRCSIHHLTFSAQSKYFSFHLLWTRNRDLINKGLEIVLRFIVVPVSIALRKERGTPRCSSTAGESQLMPLPWQELYNYSRSGEWESMAGGALPLPCWGPNSYGEKSSDTL